MSSMNQPKLGWDVFRHDSDLRFSTNCNNSVTSSQELNPEEHQEKIKNLFQTSNGSTHVEEISSSTTNGSTVNHHKVEKLESVEGSHFEGFGKPIRSIFTIDKVSCDVVLENECIKWKPVELTKRRPSSGIGSRRTSIVDRCVIYLYEIFAVKLKSMRNVKTSNASTLGFSVFYASKTASGKYREENIFFECFSRDICIEWGRRIKTYLDAFQSRPKNVLVLYRSKNSNSIEAWKDIVSPLFLSAGVTCDETQIAKAGYVRDYIPEALKMYRNNQKRLDAIIAIGKLKFFSEVLNGLMYDESPPLIGYLPTQTSCRVGTMLYGASDLISAAFHVIYGCSQQISPCEFDHDDPALQYGLSASYGFYGGDTVKQKSANRFSTNIINKGLTVTKALVQHKSYTLDISYKNHETFDLGTVDELLYVNNNASNEEEWVKSQRKNYLDVTLTTLLGLSANNQFSNKLVYAKLLSANASRRDLMSRSSLSSIRSLREKFTKQDYRHDNTEEVIDADEFIVKPSMHEEHSATSFEPLQNNTVLSSWSIDGCPLDPNVQELHTKVSLKSVTMFCSSSDQNIFRPLTDEETTKLTINAGVTYIDESVA